MGFMSAVINPMRSLHSTFSMIYQPDGDMLSAHVLFTAACSGFRTQPTFKSPEVVICSRVHWHQLLKWECGYWLICLGSLSLSNSLMTRPR